MNVNGLKRAYFLGIGGIGMSVLARFFRERGTAVNGYDRTPTPLTDRLQQEGMHIHFTDDVNLLDKDAELVVYTPAIPKDHQELNWYKDKQYPVYKRSDVLQWITELMFSITVAGTHGKTTISTMTAYLLRETGYGCNAFLGGIAVNYQSNYWSSDNNTAVIEADEYDRSFLKLKPDIAILTAIDGDHLDIYGTVEAMEDAFIEYTTNIKEGGTLLVKKGLHRESEFKGTNRITYSRDDHSADVYAAEVIRSDGGYTFDVVARDWRIDRVRLNIGGLHNVENAIAALTVAKMLGIDGEKAGHALAGFRGIRRRFEYLVRSENVTYIDDYAHHPAELAALIGSAKDMFPSRRCTVVFQPHLFSRTRDFAAGFAASLDMADEVLLLDIYPARELPMEGVSTEMIADLMTNSAHVVLSKDEVLEYINKMPVQLLITAGAGDIDKLVEPIKEILANK